MLSIEETSAVVSRQLLDHYHRGNFELEEENDQDKEISNGVWIQCNDTTTESLGDVTPVAISNASTCTFWVNSGTSYNISSTYQCDYDPSKISLGDASNAGRLEFELEVHSHQKTELQWVEFCHSLFPGHREHTIEERQAYSYFIDSFFEEVEL